MRRGKWSACCAAVMLLNGAALAESGGGAGVTVDLTGVIVALGMLAFDVLLGWMAGKILPELGAWLKERTTEGQRRMVYELTVRLVEAAEQVMGAGKGSEKLRYVIEGLKARGVEVDVDLIEAAVKEMNEKALAAMKETILPEAAEGA